MKLIDIIKINFDSIVLKFKYYIIHNINNNYNKLLIIYLTLFY